MNGSDSTTGGTASGSEATDAASTGPDATASVPPPTIYTIGHSTRSLDDVVAMLRANGVDALVDVRAYPSSRAHPQWNRQAIIDSLPHDIEYHWIRSLGGRRHTPAGTPTINTGWRVKSFRDYADHLGTADFRDGLDELLALAGPRVPAITCSEALPWRCHRRLISDALLVRGVRVRHIMSEKLTQDAHLTPFAQVTGGELSYPASGSESE